MNLVIGIAVSDVDSIKRESNVQRLMNEAFTVMYLEQQYRSLRRFPLIGEKFNRVYLSECKIPTWFYLDLVDVADNTQNTLNIDPGICAEGTRRAFHCPKTIVHNVVKVLRKRLNVQDSRRDPVADQIINTLNLQNETMKKNMAKMEMKVEELLSIMNDIQTLFLFQKYF